MSLFKDHVACPNLILTGRRVNHLTVTLWSRERNFCSSERVKLSEFELSALYCINKTMIMRYWPSVRSILLLGIVKFILWLFYANRGQQGRKRRKRPISCHLNASWTSHMTDIPWDIGDFKQLLRKRLVRWAEVIFSSPRVNASRQQWKNSFLIIKQELVLFQSISRLFQITSFAKCGWRKKRKKNRRQLFTPTVA